MKEKHKKGDATVYRGESRKYDGDENGGIIPSGYREIGNGDSVILLKDHIAKLYGRYKELSFFSAVKESPRLSEKKRAEIEIKRLGIMQHYGMGTPLLDLSKDKRVAQYFACCDDFTEDGYVYSFSESGMSGLDTKTVQSRMEIIWRANKPKKDLKNTATNRGFCFDYVNLFKTKSDNIRYERQNGYFYLHKYEYVGDTIKPVFLKYGESERIPSDKKIFRLMQLAIEDGITKEYLFPDSEENIKLIKMYCDGNINRGDQKSVFESVKKKRRASQEAIECWRVIEKLLTEDVNGYVFLQTDLRKFIESMKKEDYLKSGEKIKKELRKLRR
ncbi:MAG: FRG domain-containing protein [Lachnospiraceae bacterium]|nr:FRG domain-containing protein [Lachnospiraceae bacterium]